MAPDRPVGRALGITLEGALGTCLLASLGAVLGWPLGTPEAGVVSRGRGTGRGGGCRPPGTGACTAARAYPPLRTGLLS